MKPSDYARSALAICAVVAVLSGCGGLQPPISAPATTKQNAGVAHPMTPASSYQVLYSFGKPPDGIVPDAGLIDVKGMLYGTTRSGTGRRDGTVYTITTDGTEKVLHGFNGTDGSCMCARLLDVNRRLYGTTYFGGKDDQGTIFSITKGGYEKVVYSFRGGADGSEPVAGLVDVHATLYGTSLEGGTYGDGVVFSTTTSGKEQVLYSFAGGADGAYPWAGLVDVKGALYGTTYQGGGAGCGSDGCGVVFGVTAGGKENVLYRFGGGSDGAYPQTALIDVDGALYGTTSAGGGSSDCGSSYRPGCGVVFSVTTGGTEKVLYRFRGGTDGATPGAELINVNGTLYGTTYEGGGGSGCGSSYGCGTVFSLTTGGKEKVLHSFGGGADGAYPDAGLLDVRGTLYGTTSAGGGHRCRFGPGCGTVFALKL